MNKYERHSQILQIIKENVIQTQEELAKKLNENGIYATQATISRDIRELRLIKVSDGGDVYKYATASGESSFNLESRLKTVFSESVINVNTAKNIIVINTLAGMAQAAASAVDAIGYAEILGSIAGDDTIIVIVNDDRNAAKICSKLKMMIKS